MYLPSSYFLRVYLYAAAVLYYCLDFSIADNNGTVVVNQQMSALLEFKAKITHDPLGVTSSWNNTLHYCDWEGITCDPARRRVVLINLDSLKLTGSIPPSIGNLTYLKALHLQDNSFNGEIPPEIGFLRKLQSLMLAHNLFTGQIPSQISGCISLNNLTFSNNRLVGEIPSELGLLLHLQRLALSDNNLTGNIPFSLGNLSSLTGLALGFNGLSGLVPPSIFNLSLISKLSLGSNDLEGVLPSDLGFTLPRLQILDLASNRFSGRIPGSISNLSNLGVIQLSSNSFQGKFPLLNKLVGLTDLVIGDNFLGDGEAGDLAFVSSLPNASLIEWLDIGPNNFGGGFPTNICNCSTMTFLKIEGSKIGGKIPNCIQNLASLQVFNAWGNQFSGVIPQSIGKLVNLNELDLSINQLSGTIPASIGNLTKLTTLQLSENNLEGRIPVTLGNCGLLLQLGLSQNNLRGEIPIQILSLSSLSIGLDLSNNQLTGSLPVDVGLLSNLEGLAVSGNMLSGDIPTSLGSCLVLQVLYMDGNSFQGTIPGSLESLKGLVQLDFSHNNLSGKIPNFLKSLPLQSLNLSYNNFEGEVLSNGGVFGNATGFSVVGNSRLCGGIPELKLPHCSIRVKNQKRRSNHKNKAKFAIIFGVLGITLLVVVVFLSIYILQYRKRTKKEATTSDELGKWPMFSYHTLYKATDGFASENLIGNGGIGVVYKGVLEDNDATFVAVKVFNLEHHIADKSFKAECQVFRNIRHRNLLKIITACASSDYQGYDFKALVYEYMVNGSLDDWLHSDNSSKKLNFRQRLDIAVDVAYALDYLHHHCGSASIVHCDIKPSNVLLDADMIAHVGDFGLAKFLSEDIIRSAIHSSSVGVRGTVGYTPPEYGLGNAVSTEGDVYSFGILLLEMFTGIRPTNDTFKQGMSLHDYVKAALPERVTDIIEPGFLENIDSSESFNSMVMEVITSVLKIALSCTVESPRDRLNMTDVVAKLPLLRNTPLLLKSDSNTESLQWGTN